MEAQVHWDTAEVERVEDTMALEQQVQAEALLVLLEVILAVVVEEFQVVHLAVQV
jgi:hypothetical protein